MQEVNANNVLSSVSIVSHPSIARFALTHISVLLELVDLVVLLEHTLQEINAMLVPIHAKIVTDHQHPVVHANKDIFSIIQNVFQIVQRKLTTTVTLAFLAILLANNVKALQQNVQHANHISFMSIINVKLLVLIL